MKSQPSQPAGQPVSHPASQPASQPAVSKFKGSAAEAVACKLLEKEQL